MEATAKEVHSKAQRIRDERARTSHSVQRVRINHEIQASELREQIEVEEHVIWERKQQQVEEKRQIVEKAHEESEELKLKRSKMQEEIIESGRVNHRAYLRSKLERNIKQHVGMGECRSGTAC